MSDQQDTLTAIRRNPALVMRRALESLEKVLGTDDYQISDVTNPFVYIMENISVNGAGILLEQEAIHRRLYPSMSMSYDELYAHMCDSDYLDRFSTPSSAKFTFLIGLDELKSKAVDPDQTGISKLIIPEYTQVTVSDIKYMLLYPIEIKVMRNGGLQVLYDTKRSTPIQTLTSNSLDWSIVNVEGRRCLRVTVPLLQVNVLTVYESLNMTSPLNTNVLFEDSYYHCRVYYQSNDKLVEIKTTHTDQVFDPKYPTALLRVTEGQLNVRIPSVYYLKGLISTGKCRIDIYVSKGKMYQDLGGTNLESYSVRFLDKDGTEPLDYTAAYSRYIAPVTVLSDFNVMSTDIVDGGGDGKTFEVLREEVNENTLGANDIPISHPQLVSKVNSLGFDIVTHINNITDRVFIATKRLPLPTNALLTTPIGCQNAQLRVKVADLAALSTVSDNFERVTILPSTLYQMQNGVLKVLGNGESSRLAQLTTTDLAREINSKGYLWTPFYYVLDTSENGFSVRPYDLDRPAVKYRSLVGSNDTTSYQAAISKIELNPVSNGYYLDVLLECNSAIQALDTSKVMMQFGYQPTEGDVWCSAMATLIDASSDGYHFRCKIETNYDVKKDLRLRTTNMSIFNERQVSYYIPLDTSIDVTLLISENEHPGYVSTEIDNMLQSHLLPQQGVTTVVVRERIHMTLGYSLDRLWHQARNTVTSEDYETYEKDVPYVYSDNDFEMDELGTIKLYDKDGELTPNLLHRKGDPVVDSNGKQQIRYAAGSLKRNPNGEPILKGKRELVRTFSMFLLDGLIRFVTDTEMVTYRTLISSTIVEWANKLSDLSNSLLDNSAIHLKPTTTMGTVSVLAMSNQTTTIPVEQTMTITYYVSDTVYRNSEYKIALKKSTKSKLAELLNSTTITNSGIISAMKELGGEDVISVDVAGLGGGLSLSTITLLDESSRLTLAKRLVVSSNHTVSLEEACDVTILPHSKVAL